MTDTNFSFAIIKTNNFDPKNYNIEEYVTIKTVKGTQDDINISLIDSLEMDIKDVGNTETIIELDGKIYQMTFISEHDKDKDSSNKKNNLAKFLTLADTEINGNAVLFLISVDYDNTEKKYTNSDIKIDDVKSILNMRLQHKFLYVEDNDNIKECVTDFELNEVTKLMQLMDNTHWYAKNFSVFKYDLFIYYKKINKQDKELYKINKKMTKIVGNKILGPVIVMCKVHEKKYGDITLEEFNKLIMLCEQTSSERDITQNEIDYSKYKILSNRIKKLKVKCHYCEKILTDKINYCTGCYRIKYCGIECQKSEWHVHKEECNKSKDYIN